MKLKYKAFGKTKLVEVSSHNNATLEDYDEVLWIERGEDYYALMSSQFKNKKVLIVKREDWLRAPFADCVS